MKNVTNLWACVLTLSVAGLLLAVPQAGAGEHRHEGEHQTMHTEVKIEVEGGGHAHSGHHMMIPEGADRLTIDDLDTMAVGDTRTYVSEGGEPVVITRESDEVYLVAALGETVRMGEDMEPRMGGDGERHVIKKRIVKRPADGEEHAGDEQPMERRVEKKVVVTDDETMEWTSDDGETHECIGGDCGHLHEMHITGEPLVVEFVSESEEGGETRMEKRVLVLAKSSD